MKILVVDVSSTLPIMAIHCRDGAGLNRKLLLTRFLTSLYDIRDEEQADGMVLFCDGPGYTWQESSCTAFRRYIPLLFRDWQLYTQNTLIPLMDVVESLKIPFEMADGRLGLDLCATMCHKLEILGFESVLVTSDPILLSVVREHTVLRYTDSSSRSYRLDAKNFQETFHCESAQANTLLAFVGCPDHNISGGQQQFTKRLDLIRQYGRMDQIMAHLPEIPPNERKELESLKDYLLSLARVFTPDRTARLLIRPTDCLTKKHSPEIYQTLKNYDLLELGPRLKLNPRTLKKMERAALDGEVISTMERAEELLKKWKKAECVATVFAPDLSWVCVAYPVTKKEVTRCLVHSHSLHEFRTFLEKLLTPSIPKATHDLKSLLVRLRRAGYSPAGFLYDCMLAAWMLDAEALSIQKKPAEEIWSLPHLARTHGGKSVSESDSYNDAGVLNDVLRNLDDGENLLQFPASAALLQHTSSILKIRGLQQTRLEEYGMEDLYRNVELPLCSLLADMELAGMAVNAKAVAELDQQLLDALETARENICREAGTDFNPSSSSQLAHVLYDRMGLPAGPKTRTGWSTNQNWLAKIQEEHPIVKEVLRYKALLGLRNAGTIPLKRSLCKDGRVHAVFHNMGTVTGRVSTSGPNLQSMPLHTPEDFRLRKVFQAEPGFVVVDADYSQMELRLLAHFSEDPGMIRCFQEDRDIHIATASRMFQVAERDVTKDMRQTAKKINYEIIYGVSDRTLARELDVTEEQAKAFMDAFWSQFPNVAAYLDRVLENARETGYVSSLFRRRRSVSQLFSRSSQVRQAGMRIVSNTPIQSSAADIMKIAMLLVEGSLRKQGLKARLLLQIHDELLVECPQEEQWVVADVLSREMVSAASLKVPLRVSTGVGASWGEAHPG